MRQKFCLGFLFPFPFAVVCFVFAQVLGMWRGLNSRARAGQSGHPGRRGSDETSSCRFDKTAWFAFSRRAHGGRFHSSKFLEAKSEICFLGILLELESNSGQLLRIRHGFCARCARSHPHGMRFSFVRTEKQTAVLETFSPPETVSRRGKTELA